MASKIELNKDKRIKKEYDRLRKTFKDIDKDKLTILDGLLHRAAYMRIALEDYEADLDEKGYVEAFRQSVNVPSYERERPVARLYNTANKNYQTVIKQLIALLPDGSKVKDDDGFEDFINKRE